MAKKKNQPSATGFVDQVAKTEAPAVTKKEKKKAAPVEPVVEVPAVDADTSEDVAEAKTEDTDTSF